jgi:hydroxymethylglutaryl-CoA lyase
MVPQTVEWVECPRDAMQGIVPFIPTEKKIRYINQLLRVGFDVLDCGSFVSEKAIPQMRDTAEVLSGLDLADSPTKLLTIVANERGAETAADFPMISYLGYPFSVSETFQQRNTNASIAASLDRVKGIHRLAKASGKELVVYISMGFGNPYGDPWSAQMVKDWCKRLQEEAGVTTLALSDTIGMATPETILELFQELVPALPQVTFGAHLHTTPDTWLEKMEAAWSGGCRRFDGALKGLGGCPMAADNLTGNMPAERILDFLKDKKAITGVDMAEWSIALGMTSEVFPH